MNHPSFETVLTHLSEYKIPSLTLEGLEREALRITPQGVLAATDHPQQAGNPLTHPSITLDFGEAQPELITPPIATVKELLNELRRLHQCLLHALENSELLSPTSMPLILPQDDLAIRIANFGPTTEGRKKTNYRHHLAERYGRRTQHISGIHYNISFSNAMWRSLAEGPYRFTGKLREFKNKKYLAITRNFIRYRWLLTYLFGASPFAHSSFYLVTPVNPEYATSIRTGPGGYINNHPLPLNTLGEHLSAIQSHLLDPADGNDGFRWSSPDENYEHIRLKSKRGRNTNLITTLARSGVQYLEDRTPDVDPFCPWGISESQIRFRQMFFLFCLLKESPPLSVEARRECDQNQNQVALLGRDPRLRLIVGSQFPYLQELASAIMEELTPIAAVMDKPEKDNAYANALREQKEKLTDPGKTPSGLIIARLKESGGINDENWVNFGLAQAQKHRKILLSEESPAGSMASQGSGEGHGA